MLLTPGTPEEAGIQAEVVSRIDDRAQSWKKTGKTPAFVLLAARRGVIFFHESFGQLSPEADSPRLPKDALFPVASISKPIVASAAMILAQDGLLGLNRPVKEYIPEFSGGGKEAVLVHHLLTHTSGLNDEDLFALMEKGQDQIPVIDSQLHPNANEELFFALETPLWRPPGQLMNYNIAGYILTAEIIRRISGLTFDLFAKKRIFDPLGMKDTFFVVPTEDRSRVVRRSEDAPAAIFNSQEIMEWPSPGYGAYSTALDMARFGQMFLNHGLYGSTQVLSPATVAAMTRDQLPGIGAFFDDQENPDAYWSFGWSIAYPNKGRVYGESLPSPNYFGHGGFGGVEMWVDPGNEIVGVYFSAAIEDDYQGFHITYADLFMNMVTAGVSESSEMGSQTRTSEAPSRAAALTKMSRPTTTTLWLGSSEEAGMDAGRVNMIIDQAKDWVDAGIHSSLNIVAARHGVIFLNESFGKMSPAADAPPLPSDALFPLASVTKPITAAAVMILVEEGTLALNRPIQDYLPEFQGAGKERITLRQLLTHTSGLRDEDHLRLASANGLTANAEFSDTNRAKLYGLDYDTYLELLMELKPSCAPDERMYYAALNYDLLGEIVARAAETSFPEFVKKRILDPLGMTNTTFSVPKNLIERVVQRPDSAPAYRMLDTLLKSAPPLGGSAMYGTALDVAKFSQMFLNGGSYGDARILSPASIAAMTQDQIPGIEAYYEEEALRAAEWGLGWSVQITKKSKAYAEPLLSPGSFCHGGAGGYFVWVDPKLDLVAVYASVYLSLADNGMPVTNNDLFINSLVASVVED